MAHTPEELQTAFANQLQLVGDGAQCHRYHTDSHWTWATDRCPQCNIHHRTWLTIVKGPATWLH